MRIIPARAGFTQNRSPPKSPQTDHPRSRGVYCRSACQTQTGWGSSPLARGLPGLTVGEVRIPGIIPARAGFTVIGSSPIRGSTDHPRSRGVYPSFLCFYFCERGSSPLARGLPHHVGRPPRHHRIIPARAGFTPTGRPRSPTRPDHPRSRGVYGHLTASTVRGRGSSPLARGLRHLDRERPGRRRIIPARAGFTTPGPGASRTEADHPRSRGVYLGGVPRRRISGGSSPLARGLLIGAAHGAPHYRIIPARAGFTHQRHSVSLPSTDHPRSRGVYPRRHSAPVRLAGSSPLARGLRDGREQAESGEGIIPARAGFTPSRLETDHDC